MSLVPRCHTLHSLLCALWVVALPATDAWAVVLQPGDIVVGESEVLFRIDPATGDRTTISSSVVGTGPMFDRIGGVQIGPENEIFVADFDAHALMVVDPETGDRTLVASDTVGTGLPFRPVAVDRSVSTSFLVLERDAPALVFVDPATGDRTVVSSGSVGSGPLFGSLFDLRVRGPGTTVYVLDFGGTLLEVDWSTGDRTTVTASGTGSGPALTATRGLALEVGEDFFVVDSSLDAVVHVDGTNGDRTIVSDAGTGSGPAFDTPYDVRSEADGSLVVCDFALAAVIRVDPATGNRSVVSDAVTGTGPPLSAPRTLAVVPTSRLAEGFEGYAPDVAPAGLPITGNVLVESIGSAAPEGTQVLYLSTGPGANGGGPGIDLSGDGNVESDRAQVLFSVERGPTDPALLAFDFFVLTDAGPGGPADPIALDINDFAKPFLIEQSVQLPNGTFSAVTGFSGGPLFGNDGSAFSQGQLGGTLALPVDPGGHLFFVDVSDELDDLGDTAIRMDRIRFLPEPAAPLGVVLGGGLLAALARRQGRRTRPTGGR